MLQWRSIWEVSFGGNKEDFQKSESSSPNKGHKEVDYEFIRETVENTWNTLTNRSKTRDSLLFHIIYVLRLKIGDVLLLRFEDVENESQSIIKIFESKNSTIKQTLILQEHYEKIIEYKSELCTSI